MKKEYNIEVIPYRVRNGDHSDLLEVLDAHSSFVVTRDIKYGSQSLENIGYDPCVHIVACAKRDSKEGTNCYPCRAGDHNEGIYP